MSSSYNNFPVYSNLPAGKVTPALNQAGLRVIKMTVNLANITNTATALITDLQAGDEIVLATAVASSAINNDNKAVYLGVDAKGAAIVAGTALLLNQAAVGAQAVNTQFTNGATVKAPFIVQSGATYLNVNAASATTVMTGTVQVFLLVNPVNTP